MLQQRNLKTREEQHGEICKFVSKANDGWKRFDWSDLLIECKPGFCSYILSEEQRARRNERHGIPRPLLTIRNIYTARGRGGGNPPSQDTWPIKYVLFAKSIQFSTVNSFNMHKRINVVAVRCFQRH